MSGSRFSDFVEAGQPRVVVFSREGCHLCVDAISTVESVCAELGEAFEIRDIDGDSSLVREYSDYVPVVEVDGIQQGFWRIDESRLRRALESRG